MEGGSSRSRSQQSNNPVHSRNLGQWQRFAKGHGQSGDTDPRRLYLAGNPGRRSQPYLQGRAGVGEVTLLSDPLSPREREIIQLLAEGKSNKEVANILGISFATARTHRNNIMQKLHCHSVSDLIHYAIRNKMIHS